MKCRGGFNGPQMSLHIDSHRSQLRRIASRPPACSLVASERRRMAVAQLSIVRQLMRLIQDTRARPMLWLVCAACVSVICFWFPQVFSYPPFGNQEYIPRELAATRVVGFPFVILSSVVGWFSYRSLRGKTRKHLDAFSQWWLAIGAVLFLVAIVPLPLFVVFCVAQASLY